MSSDRVLSLLGPPLVVIGLVAGGVVLVLALDGGADVAEGSADPGPPTGEIIATARESAVLVTARGCRIESVGSGAAIPGGIVTNAHVVAGADEVSLTTAGGAQQPATVVAFDPERDLALLAVDAVALPELESSAPRGGVSAVALARDDSGTSVTVGVTPLAVTRTINIFISDIYGDGRHERHGLELAGDIGPGDSGAAVIDHEGRLVGVVFSASRRDTDVAYAVSSLELDTLVASSNDVAVATGECLGG
jgi:S1-C subfamily serine protease